MWRQHAQVGLIVQGFQWLELVDADMLDGEIRFKERWCHIAVQYYQPWQNVAIEFE